MQRTFGRLDADWDNAELLSRYDINTPSGAAAHARLRSCAGAGASAWLEIMPMGRWSVFSDTDARYGLRFRLGLDTISSICAIASSGVPMIQRRLLTICSKVSDAGS